MCLACNCGFAQRRLNFNAVGDSGFLNLLPVINEKPEGRKILLRCNRCGVISGLGNYKNDPLPFLSRPSADLWFAFRLDEKKIFSLSIIFAKGQQTIARDL